MNADTSRDTLIFMEGFSLPMEDRHAYLEQACGEDGNLRDRVEQLFKVYDRVGGFLEEPPSKIAAEHIQATLNTERPGDVIGHYKLLRQIGEGGWGIVFLARQEEPVRRKLALKVVKPGMDTRAVVARFEAERQALALMNHPNIAHVFDAGATPTGRPFFVMEFVRGLKITEYCRLKSLSTSARLGLFITICDAIQHAHQKGVIHRDIKPSNILVAETADGKPFAKVIDFGVAKSTANHQFPDRTFSTANGMMIGTPAYMSPEQAACAPMDIDTRADIYSLGVLLYELLTGTTPYDSQALLKAGLYEIRRVITLENPLPPSARLSAMPAEDLRNIAQCQHTEPFRLIRDVRGDLDWIVMKALEKDRAQRYPTANAFAMDVRRHMANEAIVARPHSRLYRFQKMARRNKGAFAGAILIATVLITSLIFISAILGNEHQARREAQAGEEMARSEAARSKLVTGLLEDMLQNIDPSVAMGEDTTMIQGILDRTSERLGAGLTNRPEVQAELSAVIGKVYRQIGLPQRGESMDRMALGIYRNSSRDFPQTAATLDELGLALINQGKLAEARLVETQALAIRKRLFGGASLEAAASMHDLAHVYIEAGRYSEAETLTRQSLVIRQNLLGTDSLEVANSLRNLTVIFGDESKWSEAEEIARQVLAIRRKHLGREHPWVASAMDDLAWAEGANGKMADAQALEREALEMRRKLLSEQHPDIAQSIYLLGDRLRQHGDLDDAEAILRTALSLQQSEPGEDQPALHYTLQSLGLTLEAEGRSKKAQTPFHR